jgi:hypothetical protein
MTRLGWEHGWSCELRPQALMQAALSAGLTQVQHPGHPFYFMVPGGQVFTVAPQT